MFAKRLLQKVTSPSSPRSAKHGNLSKADLDMRIALHYGIPATASLLAFEPIQRIMAIGTADGRIKVIGGDNIEFLFTSPKQLPYKSLEFFHNKGFLVSISTANDIQVWDLEHMRMSCCLQWECNITAFTVIQGTYFIYLGDEYGVMSVLKYNAEEGKILHLPYHITANSIAEAAGVSLTIPQSIVGLLNQPCASENRVLIAYETGLIVLWNASEARIVQVRGCKDLQLKDRIIVDSSDGARNELNDISDHGIEDKEISSLCWASSSGSILAVGYVDGDVILWNMSSSSFTKDQQAGASSSDVVKLQLSSSKRRLPVIVLHWSANSKSQSEHCGQLFIYGGDEIGSEEVLTVLSLECSSGIETLQCLSRVDLTFNGSFADMIVTPNDGAAGNNSCGNLFILTNPGQLHIYDDVILSSLLSEKEKRPSVPAIQFPVAIPTIDPNMTVSKLSLIPKDDTLSKALAEIASVMKVGATPTGTKWPLTGGVKRQLCFPKGNNVERVYMAGYQDGSVRVWDATYPTLSLICILEGEVQDIKADDASAAVSALDFCSLTMSLAVGNECGLIRVYKLSGSSQDMSFHFVTETKHEVHGIHEGKGFQCVAVFSIRSSPVRNLQYANSGDRVAVGFECGLVGMFDMSSLSILFLTESVSGSGSPIISMTGKAFTDIRSLIDSSNHQQSSTKDTADVLLLLTKDSHIVAMDSANGDVICSSMVCQKKESTAISMHVIESSILVSEVSNEKQLEQLSQTSPTQNELKQTSNLGEVTKQKQLHTSCETTSVESVSDSLVLLCSEDALHLFSLKSVLKGNNDSIHKVNFGEPCCWSTTFKKNDGIASGVFLLYRTGAVEIRSLPDLAVVEEHSLMSILRWIVKENMEKTMCSSDSGQISLVNGCEMAFISLLVLENDFRIPESLPCFHDKVLAAAADAAINFSLYQKKKQGTAPGILGGIIKGFKGEDKEQNPGDLMENFVKSNATDLERIFSRDPFTNPFADDPKVLDLNIDDIVIDEPVHITPSSSHHVKHDKKDKSKERDKLFEGGNADIKPRQRTADEVKAKYRKAGDASAAASQARDKLAERGEKLERLARNSEQLQSGAENFSSMANELVKNMEAKKWWNR